MGRGFAFLDLCGFTEYTNRHGDEAGVEVLALFRSSVRTVASDHGVRVAKWLGDGCMLVSVEPEALLATVLDIEESLDASHIAIPLRAGVSFGDVILFEGDDHIGSAVNLAARLSDLAGPHEILATTAAASRLPDRAVVVDREPLTVPGFSFPVPAVRICHHGRVAA